MCCPHQFVSYIEVILIKDTTVGLARGLTSDDFYREETDSLILLEMAIGIFQAVWRLLIQGEL